MDHFETIVVADARFTHDPQFTLTARTGLPRGLMLVLVAGASVEYSFDGTNVHGRLVSGAPSAAKTFDRRVFRQIWFRGTATVDVETWEQV